jgi:sigma-54 dependent transcriptional regulator, acetoin dehydrogenase operon transcriptional activator AcoR
VTEASSPRHPVASRALTLVWLFPRPSEPAVSLGLENGVELVIGNDVSRRHASIRRDGSELVISDLGSRNGVHVNARPVSTSHLAAGDVVRLGGWVGVVSAAVGEFSELAPGLLGGAVLADALAPLRKAAPSDLPVVLEGETGTGKEVVTRALHAWSARSGPLVAVNCASLPEGLAEAELFGYRRGAFTGADRSSPGLFRSADGGTLLLDEVSDLPMSVQAKLLRVLEQREVQPLGEARPVPIDVRIVVAGQASLAEAVHEGRFRADLLARLEGVTVRLPPLRKRREDVLPLFSRFLNEQSGGRAPAVEADLVERLLVHDWPFNVRELVLLVRRLLVLHGGESTLHAAHLPERMGDSSPESPKKSEPSMPGTASDAVELPALIVALRAAGGNVARASAMLGISRQRAYRLMESHGVNLDALRSHEEPT